MKNRFTFLIITSKAGVQKKFSISKYLVYCIIALFVFLLGSGLVGIWKYKENAALKKESLLLEAEKEQLKAVARTVQDIKSEQKDIKNMLGLENGASENEKP